MRITKSLLSLTLLLMGVSQLKAQSKAHIDYIQRYTTVAVDEMKLYDIPASITLAQGMLESGLGKSRLSMEANNHFGIKCHGDWEGETIKHDDNKRNECFRKYPSAWGSYRDHSKFLQRSRYSFLFDYNITDYKKWAYGLKKAGYATDSKYPKRLIQLIEDNKLYEIDEAVVRGETIPHYREPKGGEGLTQEKVLAAAPSLRGFEPGKRHKIYLHENGREYVVAYPGDTPESIADRFNKRLSRVMYYNDLRYDSALLPGQYVFLESKKTKGETKYYQVKEGDTMYLIAQQNGITLKALYDRNRMKVGEQARVGQTLYLRGKKKK